MPSFVTSGHRCLKDGVASFVHVPGIRVFEQSKMWKVRASPIVTGEA
jgi:hypothetical protein